MPWSQTQQSEDTHDQMTILIGSAIRLMRGEAGVFVVSNEAFDPQSSSEYIFYRLNETLLPQLLSSVQGRIQPNSLHPLVVDKVTAELERQLHVEEDTERGSDPACCSEKNIERCSLLIYDLAGSLGVLHFLRVAGERSCFEKGRNLYETWVAPPPEANQGISYTMPEEAQGEEALYLFIAQVAAGLRFALKSQALVKEQGRLAAIFQYSTEGILTVDNALRIIDFNPAMERLTGWREIEVLGRFYFEVLRPKDRQGNDLGLEGSPILQSFAGQPVINREMALSARDGQRFDVSVTAVCVRNSRGEPMNGILTIRDMTREREQEEQRSTFISVVSHELQTPIAIIKGYASTLARSDVSFDPRVVRSRLVAVEEEADRLNKLVGNLLYASRIQAGGLQMDIATLELAPLIEGVVRRLQAKFPDIEITLELPANLPVVAADRERIEEVLQNLLDNAVKYSPKKRTVKVSCHATGEEVIVSVSDAGMGISVRDQEQIFERFQRVGDSMSQAIPGAGLGLYICRSIVEAHGGHMWVESALHEGSTFSFSLPREEKAHLPMVVF